MTEGQEVLERRLFSVQSKQTEAVLAQTPIGVFFIRSVTDTVLQRPFSETVCRPPRTTSDPRTTL
jgi:hypothetical protein